ncbi:GNAT family N-acetyltransferase [Flavobacterium phycosphaerae]|uniref:GNAT family N-acetyltransferase n=1 Tax=Flavobacterium phycosphaerae TaxID=2697515 RepID=UPI00138AB0C8|nr:GNAT family protein [Flavobacterium phycosphaerae]
MSPFETLSTARLLLRKLTPEIFDYIYLHYSDAELMTFLGTADEAALAKEKEKHRKGLATFNKSFCYFLILDKNTTKIIGWCGFHTWYLDHNRAEIGYGLFDDAYKQKGIMSEAAKAILDYGFGPMNLHRVEALIGKDNMASLSLVKKFGFTQEGLLREHYFTNNTIEDSVVFGLLRQEYQ